MIETNVSSYEDVSTEYYDSVLHPTCANFREASKHLISEWFQRSPLIQSSVCEIGAGKSLVAELLLERQYLQNLLLVFDSSQGMLGYSKEFLDPFTRLALAEASNLPIPSESMNLAVSSLGDPYNYSAVWNEVYRVLKPGALWYFTTPAYDWSIAYRAQSGFFDLAAFELRDGQDALLPSFIYPRDEQLTLFENSGFLVREYAAVTASALTSNRISPKLLLNRGPNAIIVEGYVVQKP